MRVSFQEQLDRTEAALQEEGALVLRALRGAMNALWEQDTELADEVIAFDDQIDALLPHPGRLQSLLARQTPVAVDLRLVLALLYSNLHLERMGDYCVTIAKLTKLARTRSRAGDHRRVRGHGRPGRGDDPRRARRLRAARLEAAESLVDLDELIDRANRRVVEHVLALGSDPERREWGLRMISSRAASSGSAITPSTSASRSRTW